MLYGAEVSPSTVWDKKKKLMLDIDVIVTQKKVSL